MSNNNTPAQLTNLKVTPHDSFHKSRTQFRKNTKASSTSPTSLTAATNDCTLFNSSSARSRLEALEFCLTQEDQDEEEEEEKKNNTEQRDQKQQVSASYKSSCKQIRNNNDKKKSVHHHTQHNTSVTATNMPLEPITITSGATRYSSLWQWWWCGGGLRPSAAACVTLLILSTTCSLCSASLCESQSWWDPYKDKCIPCTVCQGDMIPLRPCQMHRDTVCGSIYDLKIDWVVLSKTEPNWKERRKFDGLDYGLDHHQLTAEQLQQLQDETDPMDWQTAALFLAVLACLLFFIVAACILVHHMRQWRRMERRLDQDVEELSTKLMAKLAEVQSLEGGTFFIGNADALRIPATATMTAAPTFHQPHRVMLPEKSDKHQPNHHHHDRHLISNMTTLKSGNVYIEENSSKC